MNADAVESDVTEFLRTALGEGARAVPKLEAMARAAGLLGERQRISNAKGFRRAKLDLGIKSVRDGFGSDGEWLWELPQPSEPSAKSKDQEPAPTRRIPADWVEGVARLDYFRPPSDMPPHRWRQFVDDCTSFLNSPWAERAAALGWIAMTLFGCRRNHPSCT